MTSLYDCQTIYYIVGKIDPIRGDCAPAAEGLVEEGMKGGSLEAADENRGFSTSWFHLVAGPYIPFSLSGRQACSEGIARLRRRD